MGTEIEADSRALRFSRRERALAQMEAHDLDALVLGRQANVRYISGAPQLWVVGTRPFGPICEFVRETGEIHLNSTWDEGIPAEIPHENLYGFAWNPMTLVGILQNIKGAETFRRVGTDALTPMFAQLLPMAFPNAELVDAEQAMQYARDVYTRRLEGCSIWVVRSAEIHASQESEGEAFFDPAEDKIYRHASFYDVPEDLKL